MKLKCGAVAIILVGVLCLGTGIGIGKLTQPMTIVNESTSYSSADSYAVAGTITVNNDGVYGVVVIDMENVTNVTVSTVTNGVTNNATNFTIFNKKKVRFTPQNDKTILSN